MTRHPYPRPSTYTQRWKRVRRRYFAICMNCAGSGFLATKTGVKECPECKGTGNVERYLTEIVSDSE